MVNSDPNAAANGSDGQKTGTKSQPNANETHENNKKPNTGPDQVVNETQSPPSSPRPVGFAVQRSESLQSVSSSGPGVSDEVRSPQPPPVPPAAKNPKSNHYNDNVFDCCCLVITCPAHNKMVLSKSTKKVWLPYLSLQSTDTWSATARFGTNLALSAGDTSILPLPLTTPQLLHVQRLELPEIRRFVVRVTYSIKVSHEANEKKNWACCTETDFIQWVPLDHLSTGTTPYLWGPEPIILLPLMKQSDAFIEPLEFSADDATNFLTNQNRSTKSQNEELMKAALFKMADVSKVYGDFLQHCYPSFFMTFVSFAAYMVKIGWPPDDATLVPMFRAMSLFKRGYLDFHEFLLGLAAMEHATQHGGLVGPVRTRYIFRYYDANGDGVLDDSDIERMTQDIRSVKDDKTADKELQVEVTERLGILRKVQSDLKASAINEDVLITAIGNLKFRGTSVLFRSHLNIIKAINGRRAYDNISGTSAPSGVGKRRIPGLCPSCGPKRLHYDSFSLMLDCNGRPVDVTDLAMSDPQDCPEVKGLDSRTDMLLTYSRNVQFNCQSLANSVLNSLRTFDHVLGRRSLFPVPGLDQSFVDERAKSQTRDWPFDKTNAVDIIGRLAAEAADIVSQESRVLKVQSPCFVFGDLHGNFNDLMQYEKTIWPTAPAIGGASYLFLGDYVDRGEWGVEVTCYLMAMKILSPDSFFLCRGNHEIRYIQKSFSFFKECQKKFGDAAGKLIFEHINNFFDRLPLAAVIDENIFCAHGGFPFSALNVDAINEVPCPLRDPEREAPLAWEILWNDPMNEKDFEQYDKMVPKPLMKGGFTANTKRGTAYYYTDEAVDHFLQTNNFTNIIRAHELMPHGYKFHMNGKVLTIFSSSNYGGNGNKAACVFVDCDKIRILRLEC
ncbi:Serine/threonine-protein phosphatase 2B catalytic subunit alpha isoform [Halotydeus destructor]|nr:Serine/threonine-protein phosphatase 2B catalytic subunit alpha isoform [Halotydeus destructor]